MNEQENQENQVKSTSTGALQAPTVGGAGFQSIGGDANRIAREAIKRVENAGTDDADFAYKNTFLDMDNQINAARGQKNLIGLGALQSVGDLRDTIFENERKRRESAANSGFAGPMQDIRSQRDFNSKISSSERSMERDTENKLRGQNVQISQLSDAELNQLRGTGAMNKVIAEEVARRQLGSKEDNLFDMSHDQGFWGTAMGPLWGKDQTYSADLHAKELQKSEYFKNIFSELGLDINNDDVVSKISKALSKTVTGRRNVQGIGDVFSKQGWSDNFQGRGNDRSATVDFGGKKTSSTLGTSKRGLRNLGSLDDLAKAYKASGK